MPASYERLLGLHLEHTQFNFEQSSKMATIAFPNYSEIVRLPAGVTYKYIFTLAKDGNPIISLFTVFSQAAKTGTIK
jgi:hypothetical protein